MQREIYLKGFIDLEVAYSVICMRLSDLAMSKYWRSWEITSQMGCNIDIRFLGTASVLYESFQQYDLLLSICKISAY